jgi:hypothetical protein
MAEFQLEGLKHVDVFFQEFLRFFLKLRVPDDRIFSIYSLKLLTLKKIHFSKAKNVLINL